MTSFLVSNGISIALACTAAGLLLNRFFRKSVFVRVGIVWCFNLLFLMFMTGVKYKFFEENTLVSASITFKGGSGTVVRGGERAGGQCRRGGFFDAGDGCQYSSEYR